MKPNCTTPSCANTSRYESAGKCGRCYRKYHKNNPEKIRNYMTETKEAREAGDVSAPDDRTSDAFERYKAAVESIVVKLKNATIRQINQRIEKACRKANAPNRERWLLCALESLQTDGVLWKDARHAQFSVYRAGVEPRRRSLPPTEIKGQYSAQMSVWENV